MKALASADGRKRPKRIAKKIAKRGGLLHYAGRQEALLFMAALERMICAFGDFVGDAAANPRGWDCYPKGEG